MLGGLVADPGDPRPRWVLALVTSDNRRPLPRERVIRRPSTERVIAVRAPGFREGVALELDLSEGRIRDLACGLFPRGGVRRDAVRPLLDDRGRGGSASEGLENCGLLPPNYVIRRKSEEPIPVERHIVGDHGLCARVAAPDRDTDRTISGHVPDETLYGLVHALWIDCVAHDSDPSAAPMAAAIAS